MQQTGNLWKQGVSQLFLSVVALKCQLSSNLFHICESAMFMLSMKGIFMLKKHTNDSYQHQKQVEFFYTSYTD